MIKFKHISNQGYKWGFRSTVYLFLIIAFLFPAYLFAQRKGDTKEQSDKEIKANAEISLQEGKFDKALLLYRKLLEKDERNPLLNFLVGYCYQNTDFGLEQSLKYLKNASEYPSTNTEYSAPLETNYYLGKAYHANNQFNEAIAILNKMLQKTPKGEVEIAKNVNKLINYAYNGQMLSQMRANISVQNLFDINSKYSDKYPLVYDNSNSIIFSSRRENKLVSKKLDDGEFDENIFASNIRYDNWTEPYELSEPINTIDHETACWISEDGSKMIIQRFEKSIGILYLIQKNQTGGWGAPQKFNSSINDGSTNTFGSLSPDEKKLYFTSNRKGGYGGLDVYVSQYMGNNSWGEAKNLGENINTPLNEETPILDQTGKLYFSSEGHTSIGSFDIFASVPDKQGNWQRPVNLGLPINSISNDFFYWPLPDGQSAYISSDRNGTKGKSDIFKIEYRDSLMKTDGIIAGKIVGPSDLNFFQTMEIIISSLPDNKILKRIRPNNTGYYNLILPAGNSYSLEFDFKGNPIYFVQAKLDENHSISDANQTIVLKDIVINNQNPVINNFASRETFESQIESNPNLISAYNSKFKEQNTEKPTNSKPDDPILTRKYSIKLKDSPNKLPLNSFNDVSDVKEFQDKSGSYIYYFGEFDYEWEAQIKLKNIKEEYPDAEVFVFNKNI